MRRTHPSPLALLAASAAFAAPAVHAETATECQVFARERAFADSVDRHDRKAFAEFLRADSVFGAASPNTLRGRDAIVAGWADIIDGKGVQLAWRPQFVSVAEGDTVAMSRGPYVVTTKNAQGETRHAIGFFVSVWVRENAAAPWYVALDGGGPPPTPATDVEARQHLAAAPAECPRAVATAANAPSFDAARLKEGRFTYRTTLKGESLGETVIEVRRSQGHTVLSMNAPAVAQSWSATVDSSFAPISAALAMRGRKGDYRMRLDYSGDTVTGEEHDAGVERAVRARLEGQVIDQRTDWAAMMAAANAPETFALHVFDPATGSSEMRGHIGGEQALSGAWGQGVAVRLEYTIRKRDHVEEYTVYATRETPRVMLREDMPNGLVSELVRIEP